MLRLIAALQRQGLDRCKSGGQQQDKQRVSKRKMKKKIQIQKEGGQMKKEGREEEEKVRLPRR